MTTTLGERLVERIAGRTSPDRRSFLRGATLAGAALVANPWSYLTRPASAYDSVCGTHNTCDSGYTVFCCTINNGQNVCPPDSFVGGWWKADNASFCGGAARYYIDCNTYRGSTTYPCRCNDDPGTCDHRLVNCNQFRYGQCSTHIPWSSTGPVLCRLVSCTPPWQQFAGVCSTASRTDNNTRTHSAPCVSGNPPVGNVDVLTSTKNNVRIAGWAFDRDEPATSVFVAVYQDGGGLGWFPADRPRPDVNAAFGVSGDHGFDISFTAPDGPHRFEVFAINVGPAGGNPPIASRVLHVNPGSPPTGNVEVIASDGNTVRIAGWVFDPDTPNDSTSVAVYVDGAGVDWYRADRPRPDVNEALGIGGAHGFDIEVRTSNGPHTIDVYGINAGPAGANPLLARKTIEVNAGAAPRGNVDGVVVVGETVRVTGWAYDPDVPREAIPVAVYVDGAGVSWFPSGVPRPDVNEELGIPGDHGFDIDVQVPRGVHTLTVYAINAGGGYLNPPIGTRAVSVDRPGALGQVDEVSSMGQVVRVRGWAFDENDTDAEIPVAVYVDGAGVSWFDTGRPRPDVNAAYGVLGAHGYDLTFTTSPGVHTVTVYAIDSSGRHPVIGTATVTVGAA